MKSICDGNALKISSMGCDKEFLASTEMNGNPLRGTKYSWNRRIFFRQTNSMRKKIVIQQFWGVSFHRRSSFHGFDVTIVLWDYKFLYAEFKICRQCSKRRSKNIQDSEALVECISEIGLRRSRPREPHFRHAFIGPIGFVAADVEFQTCIISSIYMCERSVYK